MTLQTYSILLNSVIGVLIVGYGIWLRNIFNHQIKAKDATIEAKDAEISRLKGETAPAIAEAYAKIRAHAEAMSHEANLLNEKLELTERVLPALRLNIEIQLLARLGFRLLDLIGPTPQGDYGAFRQATYQFIREIHTEADEKIAQLPDIESASHE